MFTKLLITTILLSSSIYAAALPQPELAWGNGNSFERTILKKVAEAAGKISNYPVLQYPNRNFEGIPQLFPNNKVLIFGYGSLMNMTSAMRSVKPDSVTTMKPVLAFGMKRVFNYKAKKTSHWGENQHPKEKAMLNLVPTPTLNSVVNGIILEVDEEDFAQLIQREIGYDLIPITIVDWEDILSKNPNPKIKIAYTFVSPNELREHIRYTSTSYYPVRGYLKAVREGASLFGNDFLEFVNATTYMADGTTLVMDWNEDLFEKILCSEEP